jgi:hypothetical protein
MPLGVCEARLFTGSPNFPPWREYDQVVMGTSGREMVSAALTYTPR